MKITIDEGDLIVLCPEKEEIIYRVAGFSGRHVQLAMVNAKADPRNSSLVPFEILHEGVKSGAYGLYKLQQV